MYDGDDFKVIRGKSLPVCVRPEIGYEELRDIGHAKHAVWHSLGGVPQDYDLLYQHGVKATHIPGSGIPFTLQAFREAMGKMYNRLTLYLKKSESDNIVNDEAPAQASPPRTSTLQPVPTPPPQVDPIHVSSGEDSEVEFPALHPVRSRLMLRTRARVDPNADTVLHVVSYLFREWV